MEDAFGSVVQAAGQSNMGVPDNEKSSGAADILLNHLVSVSHQLNSD